MRIFARSGSRPLLVVLVAAVLAASIASAATPQAPASTIRLVILKFDGLPPDLVDRYVHVEDPRTGRSVLPWIDRLFYRDGIRFSNFFARGASLSEPSWAILDTGRHGVIKGNFEADRNTGSVNYYLDFVSYYADAARSHRVYPQAVESLDAAGIPLLSDAFRFEQRDTGIQLVRRGTKFNDFLQIGLNPFRGPVKERLGDLLVGVNFHRAYDDTTRAALLKALHDPTIRYVDFYSANVDEVIHDDNSETGVLAALREADRTIGQAYSAIVESGTENRTVFAVVSDHGLTFDLNGRYSQGVNLVSYLCRPELGANTVLAHDVPRANYTLNRSIFKPWVDTSAITVPPKSLLPKRSDRVTCIIDYDGNERAQMQFRSPDLNRLELLVDAMRHGGLDQARRQACARAAMDIVRAQSAKWLDEAAQVRAELAATRRLAESYERELADVDAQVAARRSAAEVSSAPLPSGPLLRAYGGRSMINATDYWTDLDQRRKELHALVWRLHSYLDQYTEVADALALRAHSNSAEDLVNAATDKLFGPFDLGDRPTAGDLMHYPIGLREITLDGAGNLDASASFMEINYLAGFTSLRVKNATRPDLAAAPVAFCATRIPCPSAVHTAIEQGIVTPNEATSIDRAYLVYGDASSQLILFVRSDHSILASPVASFDATAGSDHVTFQRAGWRPGLPFGLFEDPDLQTDGDRTDWLRSFHGDRAWLSATYRTATGLGVNNLVEVLGDDYHASFDEGMARDATEDLRLLRRLELRRRDAMQADLFVHAAPHWNFDVKDFNPGGNHGGFGHQSMKAVFWMNGGSATHAAAGPLVVTDALDGLDFAPTVFEAAGVTEAGHFSTELERGGFRTFPGRIATEAIRPRQ